MGVALHVSRPAQETPEFTAFAPHKFPELKESDLLHLDSRVGLDAPEKIGTAPRSQAMAASGIPEEADLVAHGVIITSEKKDFQEPTGQNR